MRPKLKVLAAAPVLAAMLLSSCGGGSGSGDQSAGGGADGSPVTITFLHPHPGAYTALIEAFETAHPNITVEEQAIPFNEMINQVQARLGSKDDSLDVIAVDPPRLPNMVSNGYLDEVPADVAATMPDLVSETGLSSVTYDGKQYAYPVWTSDNILFYNKEVLEAAGVTPPGSGVADRWTWEELEAAAQQVKDSGAAPYGMGIEQIDRYYALQPMIESFGGSAGLVGDQNITPDVNSPEWIKFGEWYAGLHESGLAPRGIDPSQMPEAFATGQVAFTLAGPTRIQSLQDGPLAGKWGIAPHPYFEGKPIITPTDSWAQGVSAYSKNKEAAHAFIQFATLTTEGAVATSSGFNLPPVNTAAYPVYIERMTTEVAPGQLDTLDEIITEDNTEHARHRPSSIGYVEFETTMNKAFSDIRNGADIKVTLDNAQDELTRILAKYQ